MILIAVLYTQQEKKNVNRKVKRKKWHVEDVAKWKKRKKRNNNTNPHPRQTIYRYYCWSVNTFRWAFFDCISFLFCIESYPNLSCSVLVRCCSSSLNHYISYSFTHHYDIEEKIVIVLCAFIDSLNTTVSIEIRTKLKIITVITRILSAYERKERENREKNRNAVQTQRSVYGRCFYWKGTNIQHLVFSFVTRKIYELFELNGIERRRSWPATYAYIQERIYEFLKKNQTNAKGQRRNTNPKKGSAITIMELQFNEWNWASNRFETVVLFGVGAQHHVELMDRWTYTMCMLASVFYSLRPTEFLTQIEN